MAIDDESVLVSTGLMPKSRFEVDLGPKLTKITFQEVTGLDVENQIIEYRTLFSAEKMPSITKNGNITMKRGTFVNDNTFGDWHQQVMMNTIKRRTILIKLLDEKDNVTMQWTLNNAFPSKITSTDLESDGNEVVVDSIEIIHEQIIISNGK
ncbi:phage tail protein [Chryseobacterium schmidteae]|uniref:phage tail protein n=1 Tax=Chryseobacterium schmidteae TaxID=2730404 RepID=UPI00158F326E|nr:phage tail protein [Chryseobacterium schmidteae]